MVCALMVSENKVKTASKFVAQQLVQQPNRKKPAARHQKITAWKTRGKIPHKNTWLAKKTVASIINS
jgi:hypothetical protein